MISRERGGGDVGLAAGTLVIVGAVSGLAYGLVEAAAAQVLSHWGGSLSWKHGTSFLAFLYSPLVYAVAFTLLAIPFAIAGRLVRYRAVDTWLIPALAGVGGWLMATLMGHWFSPLAAGLIGAGLAVATRRGYLRVRARFVPATRSSALKLAAGVGVVAVVALSGTWYAERRAIAALPVPDSGQPNILLLVLDTGRGDHFGPYGYRRSTTPRLDQLAARGITYEWALSSAPTTLPSHSSLLTGRRVQEHRAGWRGRRFLDRRYPTLAEYLRRNGYATAGFVANTFWAGRHTGISRGFIHYEDYYGTFFDAVIRTVAGRIVGYAMLPVMGYTNIPGRKNAERINEEILAWLKDQPRDRPFFVMANYLDIHAPYLPPEEFLHRVSARSSYHADRIEIGAWQEHDSLPSPEILKEWQDRYDESLMYLDAQVGALFDSLESKGILENTVVIVTSDHGESFGDHGVVHHGANVYLEQVRVPLLVSGPGIERGVRVSSPVDIRSVPATVADILDDPADIFPSASLLEDRTPGAIAVAEGPEIGGNPDSWQTGRGWVMSVLRDHWHYVVLESGEEQLYDAWADPGEVVNLASLDEYQALLDTLRAAADTLLPPREDQEPALGH